MSMPRKGADLFLFQLMLLLCAIWGSQQVAIKLAASDIAPLLQVVWRSAIAAVLVGLFLLWQGGWRGWLSSTWRAGLLAGSLFGLEFLFIAEGLRYTSASHMCFSTLRLFSRRWGCIFCCPASGCGLRSG